MDALGSAWEFLKRWDGRAERAGGEGEGEGEEEELCSYSLYFTHVGVSSSIELTCVDTLKDMQTPDETPCRWPVVYTRVPKRRERVQNE